MIEFVIAPDTLGGAPASDTVEPVIDGRSLVDWIADAVGEISFLGLRDPDAWLAEWRDSVAAPREVIVLGCTCGTPDCSQVTTVPEVTQASVRWATFNVSHAPATEVDQTAIPSFTFERSAFLKALDAPVRAPQPLRAAHDTDALAAARPADHQAWLRAMTRAYSRDFLFGHDSE